jgi:hypothetical protein
VSARERAHVASIPASYFGAPCLALPCRRQKCRCLVRKTGGEDVFLQPTENFLQTRCWRARIDSEFAACGNPLILRGSQVPLDDSARRVRCLWTHRSAASARHSVPVESCIQSVGRANRNAGIGQTWDCMRRAMLRRRLRAADRRHHRPGGHSQPPDSNSDWIRKGGNVSPTRALRIAQSDTGM